MAGPTGHQLAQLAGNAAIELQIGPQFHAHRNIPMFRANAHQPFEFRLDVRHDCAPVLSPARRLRQSHPLEMNHCKSGSQFGPPHFTTLDTPFWFLVPKKQSFLSVSFLRGGIGAKTTSGGEERLRRTWRNVRKWIATATHAVNGYSFSGRSWRGLSPWRSRGGLSQSSGSDRRARGPPSIPGSRRICCPRPGLGFIA